ncbi:hypothetical protein V1L52_03450 [Treponema sp. HNW]|uniref:hypothetical protein n=1 Tax=Treponema sp. HNW TaxID=3116654 RepID=UPI003D0FFBDA
MLNYTVRVLTLYKDLCYASDASSDSIDKNNFLYRYTCAVGPREPEPRLSRFLIKPRFEGYALTESAKPVTGVKTETNAGGSTIPAGLYLFLQSFMPLTEPAAADNTGNPADKKGQKKKLNIYRRAAEHLHTEALWMEIDFYDDTVYIRTLKEGNAEVFQLFRKITAKKTD